MAERHDITLREAEGPNPPKLLEQVRDAVEELLGGGAQGGTAWIKGKGEQELAKVAEIKARVMAEIAKLQLDQQRADDERAARQLAHEERMYELETDRRVRMAAALKDVAEAIARLRDCGVVIEIEVVFAMVQGAVGAGGREKLKLTHPEK